jgi:hypothetical protein
MDRTQGHQARTDEPEADRQDNELRPVASSDERDRGDNDREEHRGLQQDAAVGARKQQVLDQ